MTLPKRPQLVHKDKLDIARFSGLKGGSSHSLKPLAGRLEGLEVVAVVAFSG